MATQRLSGKAVYPAILALERVLPVPVPLLLPLLKYSEGFFQFLPLRFLPLSRKKQVSSGRNPTLYSAFFF